MQNLSTSHSCVKVNGREIYHCFELYDDDLFEIGGRTFKYSDRRCKFTYFLIRGGYCISHPDQTGFKKLFFKVYSGVLLNFEM